MSENAASYERILHDALTSYLSIREVHCALLETQVHFFKTGFNHLLYKGRVPRSRNEQLRRLRLIPHAVSVLEDEHACVAYREKAVMQFGIPTTLRFWAMTKHGDDRDITVVVSAIDDESPRFLSIFSAKRRPR